MAEPVSFAEVFSLCAKTLKEKQEMLTEFPPRNLHNMGRVAINLGNTFWYVKEQLLVLYPSEEVLNVISSNPVGLGLFLKELEGGDRSFVVWSLFSQMTSEADFLADTSGGARARSLGILEGISLGCDIGFPGKIEMVIGNETLSFYNWEDLRSQLHRSEESKALKPKLTGFGT